ncbi:thioredoxin domain-containing protein [Candidatus Saccharibacteria bacterium]|nr:thioredoxin domain-containing protein [Candidatus Saccharibacteria bacterium]
MKNAKTLVISLVVVAVGFFGLVFLLPKLTGSSSSPSSNEVDLSKYQLNSLISGNEDNGGIADHVKGAKDAPVTLFEYADYQCSACANMNSWLKELLKEYDGKVKIVYRSFPLTNIHPNAIAAASAVEAAGLQGYWEEYGDLLFANQSEWFYASGTSRTDLFMSYFTSVTKGEGDLPKFRADLSSANVKQKVAFDSAISNSLNISSTPSFFGSDGQEIDWVKSDTQTKAETLQIFRDFINQQLESTSTE